jgi:hypothetical protein
MQPEHILEQMGRLMRSNRRWKCLAITGFVALLLSAAAPWGDTQQTRSEPSQAPGRFSTEISNPTAFYTNFCRVTGTPEEMILDFGLNTQITTNPSEPVKISHRLVMNYYTLKRLVGALSMALKQHEDTYGTLELDVQKRARRKSE